MADLCTQCGYDLRGLKPLANGMKCPECASIYAGGAPKPHWLYRRRWLIGHAWGLCAAIAWGVLIARTDNGWGQMGLVVFFSALPAVAAGLLASVTTILGGRVLTPRGIRETAGPRWGGLIVDAFLVALGTSAIAVISCYIAGGIAMNVWGASGC
jgi:hypothetical protein